MLLSNFLAKFKLTKLEPLSEDLDGDQDKPRSKSLAYSVPFFSLRIKAVCALAL
jgi:hypothetical protein